MYACRIYVNLFIFLSVQDFTQLFCDSDLESITKIINENSTELKSLLISNIHESVMYLFKYMWLMNKNYLEYILKR